MELISDYIGFNQSDIAYIKALKSGDNALCKRFFNVELCGLLHRIRLEIFQGLLDYDEIVNELYLYLSKDGWAKLDSFQAKRNSRLRTWMIPVAWRFFMSERNRILLIERGKSVADSEVPFASNDDLRIQVAIDVNAVLRKMPNRRYSEIIRLLLIEGYDAGDVADMLGIRVENVYNLKHRAIRQFIDLYSD